MKTKNPDELSSSNFEDILRKINPILAHVYII